MGRCRPRQVLIYREFSLANNFHIFLIITVWVVTLKLLRISSPTLLLGPVVYSDGQYRVGDGLIAFI